MRLACQLLILLLLSVPLSWGQTNIQFRQTQPATAAWTSATAIDTVVSVPVVNNSSVLVTNNITGGTITAGTIDFEASDDGGAVWHPVYVREVDFNEPAVSGVLTALEAWRGNIAAWSNFRIRLTVAITGAGTANLRIQASSSPAPTEIAVVSSNAVNLQARVFQPTAASLNAAVVGTGTAGAPAGNILTVQGVASMTKLLVTPDSVALPANQSVNVAQVAGTNTVTGGVAGVIAVGGNVANAVAATANPVPVGGIFTTTPATLLTGQTATAQFTAAQNLKHDLTTIAGTAPTTAGKLDVKAADGDVFVRQATATNLNAAVVGTGTAGTPAGNILTIQGVASMTKLLVTPDSIALPANQSVNVAQVAGTNTVTGGVAGIIAVGGNIANAVAATANPVPVGGIFTTTPTTLNTGQTATLQFTAAQNAKTDLTTVAGTATGTAAAGVQKVGVVGNAGAAFDAATAAAPPANAVYVGGLQSGATAGLLGGITVCDTFANIQQTANTQIITGVTSRRIYICAINLVVGVAQNVAIVAGTGSVCATNTVAVPGTSGGLTAATGWNLAANSGIVVGAGLGVIAKTTVNADNLCIFQSGSAQVSGGISYSIY